MNPFVVEEKYRASFGATQTSLVALKDAYDPENLFRLNQNITPSKQAAEPALAN